MHISLVLYAEHEFNASTFTSRVIAGTGSDMYSAIIGAIGALRGPKHGGRMKCRWRSSNATKRRTKPKLISVSGWKTKKWSLVLGIRFIPSPTRATGDQTRGKAALAGRRLAEDATSPIALKQ